MIKLFNIFSFIVFILTLLSIIVVMIRAYTELDIYLINRKTEGMLLFLLITCIITRYCLNKSAYDDAIK